MIEVVVSTGDRAEADSPEAAVLAARTMIADAAAYRGIGFRPTVTFLVDGKCVAADVPRSTIGG